MKPVGRPKLSPEQKQEARLQVAVEREIERREAKAARIEKGRLDYLRRTMEKHPVGDTVTRRNLCHQIAVKTGIKFKDVDTVLEEVLVAVQGHLVAGRTVALKPFGLFRLQRFKGKIGRNPRKPDQDIPFPAATKVKFKMAKGLEEAVKEVIP